MSPVARRHGRARPPGPHPHLGSQVLPVQGHQPLAGDQPQPQEDRDRRVRDILTGAPGDVEVGLLQDVGGIDPPLEPPIEPQAHHPP